MKKYLLSITVLLLVTGCFIVQPVFSSLQDFLSRTGRIKGNILVVEGWLSYDDLKLAGDEFRTGNYDLVLTTGLRAASDFYGMFNKGSLIFYPEDTSEIRTIEVLAYSNSKKDHPLQFNLQVNDSILASFNATTRKKKYKALWNGAPVDSVLVNFDNDINAGLFISEIILNEKLHLPYLNNSVYEITADKKFRIRNNMSSNSEMAAKRLVITGIDSSYIIPIAGNRVRINRTLTTAFAVKDWIEKSGIKVEGINIISAGTHSRRTWMAYKKVLRDITDVGIIALPDRYITDKDKVRYLKTTRETIALLYYLLILSFI
ncbi:MAG TPA: hypothetical protein VHO50_02655 [Bacteroidales bacterium]|nr:hypothetical protein [Bacteroidales bacterium]